MANSSMHRLAGAVLRKLRSECRLTKPELAASLRAYGLDWTPQIISRTETGVRRLLFSESIMLADYFDVAVADFAGTVRGSIHMGDRVVLGAGAVHKLLGGCNGAR